MFSHYKVPILLLILFTACCDLAKAQGQDVRSQKMKTRSDTINKRIVDTLKLSGRDGAMVSKINREIYEKQVYYVQQNISRDSLRWYLQKLEFSRDSLMSKFLPKDKFLLYQKKRYLFFKQ